MPLYLPLKDRSFRADTPLFFPATTYYVAQKFFGKRVMPRWMERLTDSEVCLDVASSMSGATSAEGMEEMTLSMITGDDPAFDNHVARLIDWIKEGERPDAIHLSSTLLIGIAKVLRQRLTIPVVCSVQDEEVWIDSLKGDCSAAAWQGIADNVGYIDRFVTTSEFYKRIIDEKIPAIKNVEVIYPGVDGAKYASADPPKDPTIGFFYRMNEMNGLDILAEAFVALKRQNRIPNLKLKISGGYTGKDGRFLRRVKNILKPCRDDVEMGDSYSLDDHAAFYRSVSVICAPLRFEEGIGLYLCEAFAAGRPAVVPASGSFSRNYGRSGSVVPPEQ